MFLMMNEHYFNLEQKKNNGDGTGKLTKELAKRGYTIYAVEPNEDMRIQLAITLEAYTNAKILESPAENTTLPDKKGPNSRLLSFFQLRKDSSDSVMGLCFVLCQLGAKFLDFRILL